ncbi:MAG: prepilin-type N-terminal cleavage/methylation domain-containing protein [Pseudomonadota bacterium]
MSQNGFTLIEIIAVLIILGVLAAFAVPKYMDMENQARIKAAQSAIAEVRSRLSYGYAKYQIDNNGNFPGSILAICTHLNDDTILPANGNGDVAVGSDFKVTLGTDGTITVTHVDGAALTPPETGIWAVP